MGELVALTSGQSPSAFKFGTVGTPYFKVDQLGKAQKYLEQNSTPYFSTTLPTVPAGSVLIAKRGAAIALNRVRLLTQPSFMDTNVMALTPGIEIDSEFLYYWLSHRGLWDIADVTSVPQINNKHIAPLEIFLPSVAEQRKIAAALCNADELIATLERLIAKKQAIKQGMMQQLLTGRTRLPGFVASWSTRSLGDVTRIKTGSRNNQDKKAGGQYPFFVRSATVERIDSYSYDCEAILVPGEGGIGSIFHYVNGKFEVHQRVYKISDFAQDASGRFVYYFMCQYFGAHAMENSVKATVDSLRLPTFKNFQLRLPARDEQDAIVRVLDDAESEVATLEHRLTKARATKTGMMQQLLTGRTRLPAEDAS